MISRSQIYFVNLSPTQGREQAGRRRVLVVSVDAINRQPLVIAVVVGTNAKNVPPDYPTNVRVTAKESGLSTDTVFLLFSAFVPSTQPVSTIKRRTAQISPGLFQKLVCVK